MLFRDASNTQRTVAGIAFRDGGNVLRTAAGIAFRDAANVLHTSSGAGSFTATATPDTVYGYGGSGASIYISTTSTSAVPTGGTAPYTHSWASTDPDWAAIDSTHATTPFRSPLLGPGESSLATFIDTITDAFGSTATASVSVYANNLGFGI